MTRRSSRGPRLALALALAAAASLGACSSRLEAVSPLVDGWAVGPEAPCPYGPDCAHIPGIAVELLDRRDPGHAEVVRATLHLEGSQIDPATGQQILNSRSGNCCMVVRLELADGSVRAVGVGYPGISSELVALD